MLSVIFTTTISPADINGRLVIKEAANSKLSVLVQINTNSGTNALGGATMVLSIDTSSLSFNANPSQNLDYIFHNFSGSNYSTATVTQPLKGIIWINIDLPYTQSNSGEPVSDTTGWSNVVTLNFGVSDSSVVSNIKWLTESPFWGIYGDDNITMWNKGQFQNLENFSPLTGLSLFTGTLLNSNQVLLNWSILNNGNNLLGFEVERASSGQGVWEKIGFIERQGNSNSSNEYSFVDLTPHYNGSVCYRLKIIYTDGSHIYSGVIDIEAGAMTFQLSQNYPNPFNPSTKIKFSITDVESEFTLSTLKVYDILGNEVATLLNEYKPAGIYEITFEASNLASGVYLYRLTSGTFVETKKMLLLR